MIPSRDIVLMKLNDAITPNWVIGVLRYTRRAEFCLKSRPFFRGESQAAPDKVPALALFSQPAR